MIDKLTVLASLSLRQSLTHQSEIANNNVLLSLSMRQSLSSRSETNNSDVLESASLPIAGFVHPDSGWQNPKDMSYVSIHI